MLKITTCSAHIPPAAAAAVDLLLFRLMHKELKLLQLPGCSANFIDTSTATLKM